MLVSRADMMDETNVVSYCENKIGPLSLSLSHTPFSLRFRARRFGSQRRLPRHPQVAREGQPRGQEERKERRREERRTKRGKWKREQRGVVRGLADHHMGERREEEEEEEVEEKRRDGESKEEE